MVYSRSVSDEHVLFVSRDYEKSSVSTCLLIIIGSCMYWTFKQVRLYGQ